MRVLIQKNMRTSHWHHESQHALLRMWLFKSDNCRWYLRTIEIYEQQRAKRMTKVYQSDKLGNVCYDIRGPVLEQAKQLEEEGHQILKLNIGNPAAFGFNAPDEILHDVIHNLSAAQGYSDSKGLFSARKAIMQECQR